MATATLAGGFTYFEGLSVTPNTGPESGGTAITILGAGFDETTTALIGNVPVEDLVLIDSATLTGTTGVSTYGVYDVVTTTGTVVTLITNGFTYTVDDTFALTSVSPNYGSAVGGNTVTFTGTCFDSTTTFTIGGEAVTDVVIIDANTATGTVPAGIAGWVNVASQQGVAESTLTEAYQYIGISITAVSPSFDYVAGGAAMQITGIGFEPNATITVGGAALLSPTIVSDTVITGTVPPGTLGPANVIATKGGSSFTTTDSFEYIASFTATDIDPPDGFVVGGDAVTITGTGFASTCTASIGGNPCSSVVVVSSTTITAVTPPGTEGAKDVILSQYGGTATIDDGFTYVINDEDRKGDKPINKTYNGLLFLPDGLTSEAKTVLDANGAASPLAIGEKEISILGNLCASGACVGYLEPDGSVFRLGDNPDFPVGYRNISLAVMLNQALTPFHFGAKGIGLAGVEDDTLAFQQAINWCQERSYKLHIPSPGPIVNLARYYVFNKTLVITGGFEITCDRNALMIWTSASSFATSDDSPASSSDQKCGIQIGSYFGGTYPKNPTTPFCSSFNFPQLKYNPKLQAGASDVQAGGPTENNGIAAIKLVNAILVDLTVGYCWGWNTFIFNTATRGGSPNYNPSSPNDSATYCANNIIQFNTVDWGSTLIYVNCTSGNCIQGDTYIWGSTSGLSLGGKTLRVVSNINDGGVCYGMQLTIPGIYGMTSSNKTPVAISDNNVSKLSNISSFKSIMQRQRYSNKLTYNHML